MKNCSPAWILAALLALLSGGLLYQFLIKGSVLPAADQRVAIVLETGERELVLAEMRAFLQSVQQITQGIAEHDAAAVSRAARASGRAVAEAVPASLMGKLPLEFKTLGLDTHNAFDRLALDVEQMEDPAAALEPLARLLNNCLGCHAAYRLTTAGGNTD